MGQIHQLIVSEGIDQARAQTIDKFERLCVDTAFAMLSDETQRIGIMHAGFAMTALPHKDLNETAWIRQGGSIKLRIDSGIDADDKLVGLPYGSIARMILLYLQTEAIKTKSRQIELGRSMNQWLSSMGIDNGGKNYRMVREQSRRLSACRLTFYRVTDEMKRVTNGSFVRDAIFPTQETDQLTLWRDVITLDESLYKSHLDHPMPVRETAIREISTRSAAIDIYVWLAYRLYSLESPLPLTWSAVYQQFGAGYKAIRQWRPKFKESLQLALAAYPEARVGISDTGLTLYPSDPPVIQRRIA